MKRQSFTQISETFVVCFVEYFDRNIFDTTGGIEDMARIYMIVCKTVWNIYIYYGQTYPIKTIFGLFGPFQSPPMTFPDGPNGPNPSARMCPTQIQSGSTWIHQFWGSRAAYGQSTQIRRFLGRFGPPSTSKVT